MVRAQRHTAGTKAAEGLNDHLGSGDSTEPSNPSRARGKLIYTCSWHPTTLPVPKAGPQEMMA